MFITLEFEQVSIPIHKCERLMLYTDGLVDYIEYMKFSFFENRSNYIFEITANIAQHIERQAKTEQGIKDDCTVIVVDPNFRGNSYDRMLDGLTHYESIVESLLDELDLPHMRFDIHLIMMELLTNAYKYGNRRNGELPIGLRVTKYKDKLIFQVNDMGLTEKAFSIKTEIGTEDLLDENGRGLFLVQELADKVYMNDNNMIVEMHMKEVK